MSSIDWIANGIAALRSGSFLAREERSGLAAVMLSLLGDSAQYLVGVAVMGLANVFLLPLYTRVLSPSDCGLYALVELLALTLISVSGLGFPVSYLKSFAASGPGKVSKVLGTMFWANGLAAVITGTALSLFLHPAPSPIPKAMPTMDSRESLIARRIRSPMYREDFLAVHIRLNSVPAPSAGAGAIPVTQRRR